MANIKIGDIVKFNQNDRIGIGIVIYGNNRTYAVKQLKAYYEPSDPLHDISEDNIGYFDNFYWYVDKLNIQLLKGGR